MPDRDPRRAARRGGMTTADSPYCHDRRVRTGTWSSRYAAGEHEAVWHELRQVGDRVRSHDLIADAQSVCDEMARRARHNVEVIVERLSEQGYVFHANDDARTPVTPYHPPGARVEAVHDWLTEHFEVVPMTLLAWLNHVGDVWLVGTHPDWPESSSADPLVIEIEGSMYPKASITEYFDDELTAHGDAHVGGSHPPFQLPIAPDRLHKENVSGGPPYGFVLPDGCADGLLVAELALPFVSYLRWVFSRGGFPVQTGVSQAEWRVRRLLAADLLPL